jgi:hypothetical protein
MWGVPEVIEHLPMEGIKVAFIGLWLVLGKGLLLMSKSGHPCPASLNSLFLGRWG